MQPDSDQRQVRAEPTVRGVLWTDIQRTGRVGAAKTHQSTYGYVTSYDISRGKKFSVYSYVQRTIHTESSISHRTTAESHKTQRTLEMGRHRAESIRCHQTRAAKLDVHFVF